MIFSTVQLLKSIFVYLRKVQTDKDLINLLLKTAFFWDSGGCLQSIDFGHLCFGVWLSEVTNIPSAQKTDWSYSRLCEAECGS